MSQVAHFWGLLVWGLLTVACRHLTLERRFQELQKIVLYDSMTRYCERECKVFGGSGKENLHANAGDTGSILVREDPPCTTTIESVPLTWEPQQLKPSCPGAGTLQPEKPPQ